MDIYCPTLLEGYKRQQNQWSLTFCNEPQADRGVYCSVTVIDPSSVSVSTTANRPPPRLTPTTFWEALAGWGHNWMWDQMHIVGEDHWIRDSIEAGECIAVTDGSYMKELYPNLISAAFVLECSKGRGRQ